MNDYWPFITIPFHRKNVKISDGRISKIEFASGMELTVTTLTFHARLYTIGVLVRFAADAHSGVILIQASVRWQPKPGDVDMNSVT